MRKNFKSAASLLAAFALASCGGQHLGEDVVEGDDTVALPDVVTGNAACQSDNYVPGPYGALKDSTLINHCYETSEGDYLSLADIYADEEAQVLLITTSAGWCSACIEEQPYLQQWYTDHYETDYVSSLLFSKMKTWYQRIWDMQAIGKAGSA